jgi:hypothetical protein
MTKKDVEPGKAHAQHQHDRQQHCEDPRQVLFLYCCHNVLRLPGFDRRKTMQLASPSKNGRLVHRLGFDIVRITAQLKARHFFKNFLCAEDLRFGTSTTNQSL